jgi:hypothetical protein
MESFPGNALWIGYPILVGAGIAAHRIGLIERSNLCGGYLLAQFA